MNYIEIEDDLTRMKFVKINNNFAIVDTSCKIEEGSYFITTNKIIFKYHTNHFLKDEIVGKVLYLTRTPEYLQKVTSLLEQYPSEVRMLKQEIEKLQAKKKIVKKQMPSEAPKKAGRPKKTKNVRPLNAPPKKRGRPKMIPKNEVVNLEIVEKTQTPKPKRAFFDKLKQWIKK